jgi:hypothetical protein
MNSTRSNSFWRDLIIFQVVFAFFAGGLLDGGTTFWCYVVVTLLAWLMFPRLCEYRKIRPESHVTIKFVLPTLCFVLAVLLAMLVEWLRSMRGET